MNKKNDKKNKTTIHSSAAEYLTFVAAAGDSHKSVEMLLVAVSAINQHIKKILDDGELSPDSTIKKYLIVQTEGNRQVSREIDHYSLQMIISVGFKVNNDLLQICNQSSNQKQPGDNGAVSYGLT